MSRGPCISLLVEVGTDLDTEAEWERGCRTYLLS